MSKPSLRGTLRSILRPALHARGFRGDLPHLRRVTSEATHTFTVQVSKWGGEFIVELGRAPAGPYKTAAGDLIAADELLNTHLHGENRARLRAVPDATREAWFKYAPSTGARLLARAGRMLGGSTSAEAAAMEAAAREVLALLPECDRWWSGENGLPHIRSFAERDQAWRVATRDQ